MESWFWRNTIVAPLPLQAAFWPMPNCLLKSGRFITNLKADELIYSNPAMTTGARIEAVWKRVK
jgi:hypothetical protein